MSGEPDMRADWKHRDGQRLVTERVTVHQFLPIGPRTVVTDDFHGFTEQRNPNVVAVLERADGRLTWGFVDDLTVVPDER